MPTEHSDERRSALIENLANGLGVKESCELSQVSTATYYKWTKDAKFKTFGCGAAVATSSMVTEMVKGKSISEALTITNKAVAEALGGLPAVKMHCSVLAEEALKSAIEDYRKKQQARL